MSGARFAVAVLVAATACARAPDPPADATPCASQADADVAAPADLPDAPPAPDAAATTETADASEVAAEAAVDVPVDVPVDASADTLQVVDVAADAAVACFDAPPAADAAVADVPAPDAAACPVPPGPIAAWVGPDGAALGPPTLAVEVGVSDAATGAFVPYVDGQWLPIVHGNQGGIHVWAAVRVALPSVTGFKAVVEVNGQLRIDCAVVSEAWPTPPKIKVHADELAPGTFTNASGSAPGLTVIFQPGPTGNQADAAHYCGRWALLVFEARLPGEAAWGRVVRAVRLHDS